MVRISRPTVRKLTTHLVSALEIIFSSCRFSRQNSGGANDKEDVMLKQVLSLRGGVTNAMHGRVPLLRSGHLFQRGSSTSVLLSLAGAMMLVGSIAMSRDGRASSDVKVDVEAISNRADLVAGGDVLLRVTLPTELLGSAELFLNEKRLENALHPAPDGRGFLALVSGLRGGGNTVRLSAAGQTWRLVVTNHPIGGPIFSGPHLQPWQCTTEQAGLGSPIDADCNAPTQYTFFYKSTTNGAFTAYDPANPPAAAEIATTTTDRGITVPYIVREETGTLNRSIYRIAVLFDPGRGWSPWAPQRAWNGKLVYQFGAGAGTQYWQGVFSSSLLIDNLSPALLNTTPLNDAVLSRGFAVATSTLTDEAMIANAKLNAETLMMVKEHFIKAYGLIRYTISEGCSGGAIQQYSVGDQYPGLIDGFLPLCSYPDMWSLVVNGHDCVGLTRYFTTTSPQLWTNLPDRLAVLGETSEQECPGQDGPPAFGSTWFPVTNASCELPASALYNPITNPHGVRCSMKDYHINVIGVRPQDGFTYQVFDSVGLQYGLKALEAGKISPEQFVDLNEKIGGMDVDGKWQPGRTRADVMGIENMYRSGLITYGRQLAGYPIIDNRRDDNFEMHNNSEWMFTRNRILRSLKQPDADENSSAGAVNQIHWWEDVSAGGGIPTMASSVKAFNVMDRWLAAIEADTSNAPHEVKVARNRPAEAHDMCTIAGQAYDWTPGSICDSTFTYTGLIRMTAGGPDTNDVLKCRVKPLERTDYNVPFTDAQWARLRAAFPEGVCDFSKPGVEQQPPSAPWLTFMSGPGGTPLGPPPAATPDPGD
jgi:hypothetical protein